LQIGISRLKELSLQNSHTPIMESEIKKGEGRKEKKKNEKM